MRAQELAWHLDDRGVQIYDAPDHTGQWLTTPCQCPVCVRRWQVVVPLNMIGAECPYCGFFDESQWWTDEDKTHGNRQHDPNVTL